MKLLTLLLATLLSISGLAQDTTFHSSQMSVVWKDIKYSPNGEKITNYEGDVKIKLTFSKNYRPTRFVADDKVKGFHADLIITKAVDTIRTEDKTAVFFVFQAYDKLTPKTKIIFKVLTVIDQGINSFGIEDKTGTLIFFLNPPDGKL